MYSNPIKMSRPFHYYLEYVNESSLLSNLVIKIQLKLEVKGCKMSSSMEVYTTAKM
jgi:hypothetical protein